MNLPEVQNPPLQSDPPVSSAAARPSGILQRLRSWCPWRTPQSRQTFSPHRAQSEYMTRSRLPPTIDGGGFFRRSGSDAELLRNRRPRETSTPITLLRLDDKIPRQTPRQACKMSCQDGRADCPCRNLSAALQQQHSRWMARWNANEEAIRQMQQEQARQLHSLEDLQTSRWVNQISEEVLVRDDGDGKVDDNYVEAEKELEEVE